MGRERHRAAAPDNHRVPETRKGPGRRRVRANHRDRPGRRHWDTRMRRNHRAGAVGSWQGRPPHRRHRQSRRRERHPVRPLPRPRSLPRFPRPTTHRRQNVGQGRRGWCTPPSTLAVTPKPHRLLFLASPLASSLAPRAAWKIERRCASERGSPRLQPCEAVTNRTLIKLFAATLSRMATGPEAVRVAACPAPLWRAQPVIAKGWYETCARYLGW
jgi:hypothetical protein